MDEHGDEQEQHPPRWVPYTPPPPDGWDRARDWLRRLSFPLAVFLLLGGGAAAFFYWNSQLTPVRDTEATGNVRPSQVGEGGDRSQIRGTAQLAVRSSPAGATVRMNGDSVGVTPFVDSTRGAGVYMLSLQERGHFRTDTVVVLKENRADTVRLVLRPRPDYEGPETATSDPPERMVEPEQRPAPETSISASPESSRTPAPAFGALYVTSTPTGATVTMNGTERGRTPLPISKVKPGAKRVTMRLDGYQSWSAQVEVVADTTARVEADLEKRTGRLRVLARPWGTIYVNGTVHARESDVWYETQLPAGSHQLTVVHPVLGERTQEVTVQPDQETEIVVDMQAQEDAGS